MSLMRKDASKTTEPNVDDQAMPEPPVDDLDMPEPELMPEPEPNEIMSLK